MTKQSDTNDVLVFMQMAFSFVMKQVLPMVSLQMQSAIQASAGSTPRNRRQVYICKA